MTLVVYKKRNAGSGGKCLYSQLFRKMQEEPQFEASPCKVGRYCLKSKIKAKELGS
jgi:hypothetical protein